MGLCNLRMYAFGKNTDIKKFRTNTLIFAALLLLLSTPFLSARSKNLLLKPCPKGIYALTPARAYPTSALLRDSVWTEANLDGVVVRALWKDIEPLPGKYDFSRFDQAVLLASKNKKRLGIWITAGTFSPSWLYDSKTEKLVLKKNRRAGTAEILQMPAPWDKSFQAHWFGLITKLAERYDKVPELSYVAMSGMGRGMETFMVETPEDIEHFEKEGGLEKWSQAVRFIVEHYAKSFKQSTFVYVMGPPTPTEQGRQTLNLLLSELVKKYNGRLGIRNDGLRPGYENTPGVAIIDELASRTFVGFQMTLPAKNKALSPWFESAAKLKASFVEIFEGDAKNPQQQEFILKGRELLLSKKP